MVHVCIKVCQIVGMPPQHFVGGSSLTTLHVCSDGTYIYWIWSPVSFNEKTQKGHSVIMDVFQLVVRACYRGSYAKLIIFNSCSKSFLSKMYKTWASKVQNVTGLE